MKITTYFYKTICALFVLQGIASCGSDEVKPIVDPIIKDEVSFPGARWETISPEEAGFSNSKLNEVSIRYANLNSAALMVIVKGKIVYQKGKVDQKYQSHSLRKSFLSALYGPYIKNETINISNTLDQLRIDDNEGLSLIEKQATVQDLLKARSGIYHPAHYESESMVARKPERYSHQPGSFWYYNNWDFNALGSIFTQQTGKDILQAIEEDIATPLQMDFKASRDRLNGKSSGVNSRHEAYPFRISATDLARFGLLMLNNGKWKDKQLIPKEWITESTTSYSDAEESKSSGYGYMWWVEQQGTKYTLLPNLTLPNGSFMASGVGGQVLLVIPQYNMVIVHRVDTDASQSVSNGSIGSLFQLILDARII